MLEWIVELIKACMVCTGRTDELEREWIGECEKSGKTIEDFAYVQHYKEFGTDLYTKKTPAKDWLEWVQGEIAAEEARNAKSQ